MTLIKPTNMPLPHVVPPSSEMILGAIIVCILEIVFPLLMYGYWGYKKLLSRPTTINTEIKRFIKFFVVVFMILDVLWVFVMSSYRDANIDYTTIVAIPVVLLGYLAEIGIAMLVFKSKYGKSQVESTAVGTEIKWFIIIFIAAFTIINGLFIDLWMMGWL